MGGKKFFAALGSGLKSLFTKNLGVKIIALLFAVLLWAYVLVAQNPVRSKTISNVSISLEGYTDLLSRNLIVVDSDMGLATVTVSSEITNHASLDSTRINCKASLGTITAEGTYKLPLSATVQSNLGTVSSVNPSTVTVEVDRLVKKTVPVALAYSGELPEGYAILAENWSASLTVEGAARYIEPAVRAVAIVDLTDLTDDFEEAVNVVFYNEAGEEIEVVTSSKETPNVTVKLSVSDSKRLPITENLIAPDDAYYTVTCEKTMDYIVVYGDKAVLDTLTSISTEKLVLSDETGVFLEEVALLLPEGVCLREGQSSTVKLTLVVEEKIEEIELQVPLAYMNLGNGLAVGDNSPAYVTVIVRGTVRQLEKLTAGDFTATVDLKELGSGDWELAVTLQGLDEKEFPDVIASLKESTVKVELKAAG